MKTALSIAGSDSSAGAGIQADLKTFHAHGVYGLTAITAVTAQNTTGVYAVQAMPPEIVRDQIQCLFQDVPIQAVKIGMVFNQDIIQAIYQSLSKVNKPYVVLDPVMVSKSGSHLLRPGAIDSLVKDLFPLADIVTPNLKEASVLLDRPIEDLKGMEMAAQALIDKGVKRVVIKGGHLKDQQATDLYYDGQYSSFIEKEFIKTRNTHGTGCTFSSAIAANLALGLNFEQSVVQAKEYVSLAIANSIDLGRGQGPTNHFYSFLNLKE